MKNKKSTTLQKNEKPRRFDLSDNFKQVINYHVRVVAFFTAIVRRSSMMQNSKFCMATLIGSAAMAFFMQYSENE